MTADHPTPGPDDDHTAIFLDGVRVASIDVITEADLSALLGGSVADHIAALLQREMPCCETPRRGSDAYRELLEQAAHATTMEDLTAYISHIEYTYRWPGIVDHLELLVDHIVAGSSPPIEDERGYPVLARMLKTAPDEGDLLETAVGITNDPLAPPMDLDTALDLGREMALCVEVWAPLLQEALDARASGKRELVRPVLVRLPGLRDGNRDRIVQGVMVMAMAAMMVGNPRALAGQAVRCGIDPELVTPVRMKTKRGTQYR